MMKALQHVTHGDVRLGKKPPKRLLKALPLSAYMKSSEVAFPPKVAYERPLAYGMLANDLLGDCTIAAALHLQMVWSSVANAGKIPSFTDEEAIALYSAIGGYKPGDPSTDQGCVETDVLNYWKATGMQGNNIAGYATVDVNNLDQLKAAAYIFGGVYIGIQVPAYIMNVPAGGSWSYPGSGDTTIEGGHAIPVVGYGSQGVTIISWGALYHFNYQFWADNCDEGYALVDPEWIKASGVSPSGLALDDLLNDIKQV
jgi:hypothetical protein